MKGNIAPTPCYNVYVVDMNVNIAPTPCYGVAFITHVFDMNVNVLMHQLDNSAVAQGAPSPKTYRFFKSYLNVH